MTMSLEYFKLLIEDLISENKLNLRLSGVARLSDTKDVFWSASFAIDGEGEVPPVSPEHYDKANQVFRKYMPQDFQLGRIWTVQFVMQPNLASTRWQVNYLYCL